MNIVKRIDGYVEFVRDDGYVLRTLEEDVTMNYYKGSNAIHIVDLGGNGFVIKINEVRSTQILPNPIVSFNGTASQLWDVLINGFFEEKHTQGSTPPTPAIFESLVVVQEVQDLVDLYGADVNDVITIPRGAYLLDAYNFEMGNYTIQNVIGDDIHIKQHSQLTHQVSSSKINVSLFNIREANFFMSDMRIVCDGAGSEAIRMSGLGVESLDLFYVEFGAATSFGTLIGIRQGFMGACFALNSTQGFLLQGAWLGGFTILNTRLINVGSYILKGDTGFTCNAIRSNVFATIPTGAFAFDFDFNMFNVDRGYQLEGGRYEGTGKMVSDFTIGGITQAENSRKSFFNENSGNLAKNTFIGAEWRTTTEVLTPLAFNVAANILGGRTFDNLVHFQSLLVSPNFEVVRYDSSVPIDVKVTALSKIEGDSSDDIKIDLIHYVNSTVTEVIILSLIETIPNVVQADDTVNFTINARIDNLQENDRIYCKVTNLSDGSDITEKVNSFLTVELVG